MTPTHDIALVVGSLRRESISRKLAIALTGLAPASLKLDLVEIGALPLFNEDLEVAEPPAWHDFRARIRAAAGVLFVTPEYNRSVPGGLKNALDVASRPYGKSAWAGKPAGVLSITPGALGAQGANHHLRQSLVFLDMPAMAQPEAYLGQAGKLFDATGALVDEPTRAFLTKFLAAYATWVGRFVAP